MGRLKPIGSEKLQGDDKVKRIMEIARFGETNKNEEKLEKMREKIENLLQAPADGPS